MIWRCDLVPQYEAYKEEIDAGVARVLGSGRYVLAEELAAFEEEFAAYVGTTCCVGLANGTDALILALQALGVERDDEVITTPFTAIPTVSAIIATGARPVFVDIRPDTYLMDVDAALQAVTAKTRAVVPVHLFGNMVDIARLRRGLPPHVAIVEDACQAHGSALDGARAGSLGDVAAFSFYPTKNLGGYGDGGAVVTKDPALAERIRLLRMYGMVDKDHIIINGVNSRLDEVQAAVLRAKLPYLDDMNEARRRIATRYARDLMDAPLAFQRIADNVVSNYHVLEARTTVDRDRLVTALGERGIQTNVYYVLPLHLQKPVAAFGYAPGDYPVAEALCADVIALPMYPELCDDVLEGIINTIIELT